MIISEATELEDGARFFVDFNSGVKIKYHALDVAPDFSDSPVITRADGMIAFDSESGGNRERCSIVNTPDNDLDDKVFFISVEDVVSE